MLQFYSQSRLIFSINCYLYREVTFTRADDSMHKTLALPSAVRGMCILSATNLICPKVQTLCLDKCYRDTAKKVYLMAFVSP